MKPYRLKKGDTIAVVSLSSGILGEEHTKHQIRIGKERLESYGFNVKFMDNALKGIDYLKNHPEKRAEDLLNAFRINEIKGIICAIGGDDTYRLIPYLMENDVLKDVVQKNPKLFMGFSDTTVNHMMLHKLGLNTFYGQAFLTEICELSDEMLPYSKSAFEELFLKGGISSIEPSDIWYEERKDFSYAAIGTPRKSHNENHFFEVLKGYGKFSGKILGGCLETLYYMLAGEIYSDEKEIIEKYGIFPGKEEWKNRILLLETSEEKPQPDILKKMLLKLESTGIFEAVNGVLIGKPMDEKYYEEYRKIYSEVIDNNIIYNINAGHALPRAIVPFGVNVTADGEKGIIRIDEPVFEE